MRERSLAESQAGREIGRIPTIKNRRRHKRCERDLRKFCESYLSATFCIAWSNDHLRVIDRLEAAILKGGLYAIAMPRGSGKTSLCEAATLWALLYGHHQYVALIGPDEPHAIDRLKNLRIELETNDRMADDFPKIVFPIRCLEGINQRRLLYRGIPVRVEFSAKRMVLPDLVGSPAAGSVVSTAGITGQIRGLMLKRRDGSNLRPSLALIDDPQTDESANSPSQCAQREKILNGAILGLAGPGRRISAIMPCTVVRADDLADQILDPKRNAQWQSERTKMVYTWPTAEKLWEQYAELWRAGSQKNDLRAALAFYRKNRRAMDAGAEVAWPERYDPGELSAIQNAWNLRLLHKDPAFFAEYQNEPIVEKDDDADRLDAPSIARLVNNHARGIVPADCTHLTAFIDVQKTCLYYLVAGWSSQFSGAVIDYGTEPDQGIEYFTLRQIKRTLARAKPGAGREGAIYAGLERLTDRLIGREWERDDGVAMRLDRVLIDANYETALVKQFCRRSDHAGLITPSHGRYVGASSAPMDQYKRRPGERYGLNWLISVPKDRTGGRHVAFDANYWKSFIHSRLATASGDPGSLTLFGKRPEAHRMLSEQLTAEYAVRTVGRGRTVDEWKLRVSGQDNHFLDCLVGAAVAASIAGATLPTLETPKRSRSRSNPAGSRRIWRANRA